MVEDLISAIISVYNVEQFLNECISSVIHQNYSTIELISVDDGSIDDSGALCDEFALKDERIFVIHQSNGGQAQARNIGIKLCQGNWVSFIDSDDIAHPDLLAELYRCAIEQQVSIVECGRMEDYRIPGSFWQDQHYSKARLLTINSDSLFDLYENGNDAYWVVIPGIFRKEIIMLHLFTEGRIYEDNEVPCHWLVTSGKIALLDEKLYFYRNNPNGTMNRPFSRKKADYLWALEEQLKFYRSIGYDKILSVVLKEYCAVIADMIIRFRDEVHDSEFSNELIITFKRIIREYKRWVQKDTMTQRGYKLIHPILHKARKKLNLLR